MKQAKTHTPKVEIDRETELSTGSKVLSGFNERAQNLEDIHN